MHKGSCHSNHFDREGVPCKIGRKVSVKTQPESGNGYFDAKVLSRTHGKLTHGEITLDKNAVGLLVWTDVRYGSKTCKAAMGLLLTVRFLIKRW